MKQTFTMNGEILKKNIRQNLLTKMQANKQTDNEGKPQKEGRNNVAQYAGGIRNFGRQIMLKWEEKN